MKEAEISQVFDNFQAKFGEKSLRNSQLINLQAAPLRGPAGPLRGLKNLGGKEVLFRGKSQTPPKMH